MRCIIDSYKEVRGEDIFFELEIWIKYEGMSRSWKYFFLVVWDWDRDN